MSGVGFIVFVVVVVPQCLQSVIMRVNLKGCVGGVLLEEGRRSIDRSEDGDHLPYSGPFIPRGERVRLVPGIRAAAHDCCYTTEERYRYLYVQTLLLI